MGNSSKHNGSGDNITGDKVIHNNQRNIQADKYIENYHVTKIYKKIDGSQQHLSQKKMTKAKV